MVRTAEALLQAVIASRHHGGDKVADASYPEIEFECQPSKRQNSTKLRPGWQWKVIVPTCSRKYYAAAIRSTHRNGEEEDEAFGNAVSVRLACLVCWSAFGGREDLSEASDHLRKAVHKLAELVLMGRVCISHHVQSV